MREDAAWSPILREQGALEELAAIGVEIIRNARNELYLSMRFLDVALNGLFPVADNSIKGIGTDGTLLSFETGYICGWYRRNPVYVNRMILHETFHCLFVHPWSRKKRTEEYWNLACDIAVESLIDGIHKPCVHLPMSPVRAEFYGRLRKKIKVLNAESIYHTMQEMELSEIEYERLCREFCRAGEAENDVISFDFLVDRISEKTIGMTSGRRCRRRWRRFPTRRRMTPGS